MVYQLVCWLQGASKEFHASFLREAREREEQRAVEKREVRKHSRFCGLAALPTLQADRQPYSLLVLQVLQPRSAFTNATG